MSCGLNKKSGSGTSFSPNNSVFPYQRYCTSVSTVLGQTSKNEFKIKQKKKGVHYIQK
jgi:hypothetical protein